MRVCLGSEGLECALCNGPMDSHDHLYFECPFTNAIWGFAQTKGNFRVPIDG